MEEEDSPVKPSAPPSNYEEAANPPDYSDLEYYDGREDSEEPHFPGLLVADHGVRREGAVEAIENVSVLGVCTLFFFSSLLFYSGILKFLPNYSLRFCLLFL